MVAETKLGSEKINTNEVRPDQRAIRSNGGNELSSGRMKACNTKTKFEQHLLGENQSHENYE